MSTLALTKLWINRLDTGEAVSAQSSRDRSQAYTTELSVRTYASGRRRAITTAGEHGELTFRLAPVSLATIATLRTWVGVAVQVRDHRGQKHFGVFAGTSITEYMEPSLYSVGFTLQTITFTEGV